MSLIKQFKTDEKKETEGIPITYAPNADGTVPTFFIRRSGPSNPKYVKALERETAPYRRLLELGTLDPKVSEKIMRRVFCLSVLVKWENVQNQKDEVIPYSFESAISLFEFLPELYFDLHDQSTKLASFRLEMQESDAKN